MITKAAGREELFGIIKRSWCLGESTGQETGRPALGHSPCSEGGQLPGEKTVTCEKTAARSQEARSQLSVWIGGDKRRCALIRVGGVISLRSSDQQPPGEDMGTLQGRLSLIKSLTCQIVSDLAKVDQGDFNRDIDCTDTELEEESTGLCHIILKR